MTELLQQAFAAVQRLDPETQDEIAHVMKILAGEEDEGQPVPLTSEDRVAIARSKDAAARGEFATDEQIRAIRAKHGL